jgi:hypothetical protein
MTIELTIRYDNATQDNTIMPQTIPATNEGTLVG